jgi:hypothetical protein
LLFLSKRHSGCGSNLHDYIFTYCFSLSRRRLLGGKAEKFCVPALNCFSPPSDGCKREKKGGEAVLWRKEKGTKMKTKEKLLKADTILMIMHAISPTYFLTRKENSYVFVLPAAHSFSAKQRSEILVKVLLIRQCDHHM